MIYIFLKWHLLNTIVSNNAVVYILEYKFYDELIPNSCKKTDKRPANLKLTELDVEKSKGTSLYDFHIK